MKKFINLMVLILLILGLNGGLLADELLRQYEPNHEQFERLEIGDKIVYFQQRMIDNAIVEKDFNVYQFNKYTKKLLDKKTHWRDGLPDHVDINFNKAYAKSMAPGDIQFTKLYIISPDSDVFPLDPTPENPCWVVRSTDMDTGYPVVTIIDAVTGEKLSNGVPPPANGFSLSGPQYENPCHGIWTAWYQNAESWFNTMGYPTEAVEWPTQSKVQSHIQNLDTSLFYELAHGSSYSFVNGCLDGSNYDFLFASDIETWISSYRKMPFAFIGSCDGLCNVSDGTFSYEFRKGSSTDTVTVGYCGMSEDYCYSCWVNSVDWQDALFSYMNNGNTVKKAFDSALADYPMCASCVRFAGDVNFNIGGQDIYVESSGTCNGNSPCYSTIQGAVNAASSGVTIKIAGGSYGEDVSLSTSKNLTFKGGYDSTFTTQSSETTFQTMTMSNGTAIVDKLTMQ